MKAIAWTVLLLCAVGCSEAVDTETNPYVIPKDSLAAILVEVHFQNAIIQHKQVKGKPLEVLAWEKYDQLFDSLHVSKERFDSSMNYYLSIPGAMEPIYDDALSVLSTRMAALGPIAKDTSETDLGEKSEIEAMMDKLPPEMVHSRKGINKAKRPAPSPPKTDRPRRKRIPKSE